MLVTELVPVKVGEVAFGDRVEVSVPKPTAAFGARAGFRPADGRRNDVLTRRQTPSSKVISEPCSS
jgi:hypothetical protein